MWLARKERAIDWNCWDDEQRGKWGPYEEYVNPVTVRKEMAEQFLGKEYMAVGRHLAQARKELQEEQADRDEGRLPRKEFTKAVFTRAQRLGLVLLRIITQWPLAVKQMAAVLAVKK